MGEQLSDTLLENYTLTFDPGPAEEGGQAVRPPRNQTRVPRIIIVKGPNFF